MTLRPSMGTPRKLVRLMKSVVFPLGIDTE